MIKIMARKSLDGITKRASHNLGDTPPRRRASTQPVRRRNLGAYGDESVAIDRIVRDKHKSRRQSSREDFLKPVDVFDFDESDVEELQAADDRRHHRFASKKPKKKWSRKRKIITFSILGLILAAIIFVILYFNDIIARLTGGNSGIGDVFSALVDDYVDLKTDANGRTNVLVIGTSGYDMGGSGHDGAQLTDTVMLVSFHEPTNDVAMVSIPRDFKVTGSCYSSNKINELYSCNSDNGANDAAGAAALAETVSEILGVDIQYYAHVDWGALVQIVDTIGGITVTLDEDVDDRNYTGTIIQAGVPTELNGEQALGLARARHGTSGGDFSRGTNQQKIIEAIINKVQSQGLGVSDALSMVSALGDNLRTDFTLQELKTIAHYGESFNTDNIRQISLYQAEDGTYYLKTAMINGISYVIPAQGDGRYGNIQDYIAYELSTDPVTREDAAILVLNGSGEAGVAQVEAEKLEEKGYYVANYANAWDDNFSGYTIYALNSDKPQTLSALESLYGVTDSDNSAIPSDKDYSDYDIIIVVGASSEAN